MRKFSWPSLRIPHPRLPAITIMSLLPTLRTRLNFGGTKVTIGALAIVAIGFTATIWVTVAGSKHEIIFPTPGAEYELPSVVGERLPPDEQTPMTASQTLRIGFKDKTRLDRVVLKNLDLGKADLSTAFQVTRNATTGVTGAQAYLFIGDIVITNSSAPTLAWGNMELGSVSLAPRVDGHTQEIQQDSTVTQVIIDSDRGAGTYTAQDSKVDRVILQINGTNGASIGVLEVDNVDASTGAMEWNYIKAGSLTMDGTNEFGNGTGINTASATWADSISSRTIVDNLVDVPISVK